MTNGQFESPVVMNHGETYNEKEVLQDRYPYVICPECLSQNTEVVRKHRGPCEDFHTGDHSTKRNGIWVYDVVRANYQCKDCKCEYYQWLATDRHFLFSDIEIDEDVRNTLLCLFFIILFVAVWVFSWGSINDDSPWWIVALAITGPLGTVVTVLIGAEVISG